jgi:hypothetical protein
MGIPAFAVVRHCSTQLFLSGLFSGYSLDHIWSGDKHEAGVLYHKYKICHRRRINCSAGTRTHDGGKLRDHAAGAGITEEDISITLQGIHTFLNPGSTRIIDAYAGYSSFECHIHHLADLGGMHLAQRTTPGRKIL